MVNPLVSCIVVTTAKRKEYFSQLLRCWWEQTYLNTELIVVSEDDMSDVLPVHPRIHFVLCPTGTSLGQKRNIACENSHGEIIAHFDDDDWSAPIRIEECVDALIKKKVFVTGYRVARFYEVDTKLARVWDGGPNWIQGSSLVYVKTFWQGHKFEDIPSGEDLKFMFSAGLIFTMNGIDRMVFRDHSGNTWPRAEKYNLQWKIIDSKSTQELLFGQKSIKIAMGMLTWNDKETTLKNLQTLLVEATRLRQFNFDPEVIVVDNGSTDGTKLALKKVKGIHIISNKKNLGIAPARNQLFEYAKDIDAEYTFSIDCDIAVVPFSVLEMLRWLRPRASMAACIGTEWTFCTEDKTKVANWCPTITEVKIQPHQAPLGYGLWFTNVLNRYRFDERFGPGWGGEDNDLALTIENETYLRMYVFPLKYLHLHPHKSIDLLKVDGIDPEKVVRERYQIIIDKWGKVPEFAPFVKVLIQFQKQEDNILPV